MLTLPPAVRIYVAKQPVDMRKSFRGLSGVIRQLQHDPTSGHLFCFFNKRRTLIKVFFFDRTGYSIFYKRLAKGTFQVPDSEEEAISIDAGLLALILEGIDIKTAVQRPRYRRRT